MPAVYEHETVVRYHECDAYGHVNNANYARYMQEAAFDASAAAGFPHAWYAERGLSFVVRASQIEYLQQAAYKDRIRVRTWISDARRVSARRQYEMHDALSGALICRAHTDWVLANIIERKLVSMPPEMLAAFAPERNGAEAARPLEVQQAPQARETFRMRRSVRFQDLDSGSVVNNPVYLDYCSDAGFECVAHFGWPVQRQLDASFGIYYRNMAIEYVQPAMLGDDIDVAAWLSDIKRVSGMRHFLLTRASDGALLARANALCVCANLKTGAPMRWPEGILSGLSANVAAE
jgi:acyl-CoA thioester hydrolase